MSQLCRWAFTLHSTADFNIEEEESVCTELLRDTLKKITKPKYVFQLERGKESLKLHYQGRLSFSRPKRKHEALKLFHGRLAHIHLSIEHDEEKSSFYSIKQDDTFVKGPWSSEDKEFYIPRQIRDIQTLYPWQSSILEISKEWNTRVIHVIIDTNGNTGKSTLCTYMGVNKAGKLLPFCNDYKDILRMCYDVGVYKNYIIDMPRAINKDKLYQFYGAIETIKSGYCFDDRYKFQDRYFDCPNVFVFTNQKPDTSLLSSDRWFLLTIQNRKLETYRD